MSDNSEPNPTQTELTSTEQLVGLVPIQADDQNIDVQLIEGAEEDFFGSQAIELNGERHVIVSQAQDPETGEMLLVLRGENGEHIAIQPEALSSMVQASASGDHIQLAVETTEGSLAIASDISSLSHSVPSELSSLSTSLSALPSIIASIPSQSQTSTAPTNVVQSIDTPRVSKEEQPSSLPIASVTESVSKTSETAEPETTVTPVEEPHKETVPEKETEKEVQQKKTEEVAVEKKSEAEVPAITSDANEASKQPLPSEATEKTDAEKNKKEEPIPTDLPSEPSEDKKTVETKPADETTKEEAAKVVEEKSETPIIPENKSETTEKIAETVAETKTTEAVSTSELSNGLSNSVDTVVSQPTNVSSNLVESTDTTITTTSTTTPISSSINTSIADEITTSAEKSTKVSTDSTDIGFGNTAVIQVQDSNTDASLEQLMANAVLTADGNYVLMAQTEDGQVTGLPSELNLSEVISAGAAGGQTFLIETPEGLVACTAASSGEDGAIQLIPTEAGDLESAVISSAQSGGAVQDQIIQAISGGQAMSYTINSATGCLELTTVSSAPTPTQSTASKPVRGNRNTRPSKTKIIPNISSGQTLLLAADTATESPSVSVTKTVSTPSARSRNANPKAKGGRTGVSVDSGVNLKDSAISANVQQIKSNARTAAEAAKSITTLGNNVSEETSAPPGPSQLAASRRTYSKKSNIVWITPDASQGANTTAFATVATASVKSSPNISQPQKQKTSTNMNSSANKTTVQTSVPSPVKASSPSKSITPSMIQSTSSPTKVTISSLSANTSQPKQTVQSTPTAVTISKSSALKTIAADKNTTPTADKSKSVAKTAATPTVTKPVTASKTTITMKTSSQPSASKGQTPNLKIESSIDSKILTKTPIRMSDITSTKSPTPTSPTKPTATKTVVTVSSSKDKTSVTTKSLAQRTSTTPKSVAPMPSNRTSSAAKPTTITVGSVSTPKPNTSSKQGVTSAKTAQSVSVAEKGDNKLGEKLVTKGKVADEVKVNSLSESQSTVASDVTTNKSKTTDKTAKKAPEKTVSTRHSARLSPSKSIKPESIPVTSKETTNRHNLDDSQPEPEPEPKPQPNKANEEKETTKNKTELTNDETHVSKQKQSATKESVPTPQPPEKVAESEAKPVKESIDSNKSAKKSRRSSRNVTNVEESKKESTTTEESEATTTEAKPKESKESKEVDLKKSKDKPPVEVVATRRSSGRQKAVKDVAVNEEKSVVTEPAIVAQPPTTEPTIPETPTPTPTQESAKSSRVTRASRGKAPETKSVKQEEPVSKTPEAKPKNESTEKITKSDSEKKIEKEVEVPKEKDKEVSKEKDKEVTDKPIVEKEKSEEIKSKESVTTSVETPTATRSVKKRVQFEVKEKSPEKETTKANEEKSDKSKEGVTPILTRRSLRSATPQTVNQVQSDTEANQKDSKSDETNADSKTADNTDESTNKTPQRVSARKRKEVAKSAEPEEPKPAKTPKRGSRKSDTVVNQNTAAAEQIPEPITSSRVKDKKPKAVKRIESRIGSKDSRHSIDSSETYVRTARKQSLIQSYIDENEWQEKEADLRRKTISSLSDLRSPNECYDYTSNECRFYIRHQSSSVSPKQSAGNYLCQKCGFHTTRINNLVIHHRDQCSYIKNAVIQQWQTVQAEMQAKRGRTADSALATSSASEAKRRKTSENNEDSNHLDKHTDESEIESEDERHEELLTNNDRSNQNPTISDIDAMLMGSDDEDLLSIDNIDNPKRVFGFAEDDIVWVETNDTHWPALVSKVFTKEKKAWIRLIDSPWPKKSMKVNTSSISPFDSAEVNKQYLRDGPKTSTSTGDFLVKAVQKAEEFLRKKCLGSDVSATKFFDSESETNVEDDERIRSILNKDPTKESKTVKESTLEGSAGVAINTNGDDLAIDKLPESSEAIAQSKEKRRQQNAKFLHCIKDGKVETHLVGVYRGTITSERHQKFLSGSESEKNQLKHVPWFGPIDDEEQQEEIYDYCSQLFKSNFKTDGSFDTVAYIFEVWVPEAIVKAISRVRRIELKDSEQIFAEGVSLSQSENDELAKAIQKEAEKHSTSATTSD